ncbi:hypothetical protein TSUD_70360 [Trifolium subterraneum]|uniref:Uncharacterized protein n=1 Tax=Trifolium subterraneum TaxID=3900 RepID=A0A2Z6M5I0_TRISU|nr:hypothetical protein TSUD_70360 [Trifolium subterraneum]
MEKKMCPIGKEKSKYLGWPMGYTSSPIFSSSVQSEAYGNPFVGGAFEPDRLSTARPKSSRGRSKPPPTNGFPYASICTDELKIVPKLKLKAPILSLNDTNKNKGYNKFKNFPKLHLIKASAFGVWFEDAAELEGKLIGEGKKVEVKNLEE